MRLGQLARKLSLRPTQIIEFLSQQNIQIEDSSNARIEDSHVVLVVQRFAPESMDKIVQEAYEVEVIEEIIPEENSQLVVEEPIAYVQRDETERVEEVEVIRVPKIELSGLKVLGKIELPEIKKKETTPDPIENANAPSVIEEPTGQQKPPVRKPKGKKIHTKRDRPNKAEWTNPLERQREREANEAEEKKRMEVERLKEKRKKHYQEKVRATVQPKQVKPPKDEPEIRVKPTKTTKPTTWVGKFWKWLRQDE